MPKRTTAMDRFLAKVVKTDSCWLWQAATSSEGYGAFWFEGALTPAHRWLYGQTVGPLEDGSHIDHLCRVRSCVNPSHLEQVSERTNVLRGEGPCAENARKDSCVHGHPYSLTNTRIRPDGKRACRTCAREDSRRRRLITA